MYLLREHGLQVVAVAARLIDERAERGGEDEQRDRQRPSEQVDL